MDVQSGFKFTTIAKILVVLSAVWAIGRVGLSTIPGISSAADNAFGWPFNELSQYSAFSATSPVGSILFTLMGRNDPRIFLGLHVVALVVAVLAMLWWVKLMTPRSTRLMAFRLVFLSPWVALLLIFLGSYDPFTVIGFVLLLLAWKTSKPVLVLGASFLLGFQHFEQSFFAVIAAFLTAIALRERLPAGYIQPKQFVFALSGLVFGKLALTLILTLSSSSGAFGRSAFWSAEWLRMSLVTSVNFWAVLFLSLFAGSWGLVVATSLSVQRRQQFLLLAAFLLCLIPALITLDHTRVFVMSSVMALSIITVAFARSSETFKSKESIYVEVLAWVIVPISVWVGMDATPYLHPVGSLDQLIIFYNQLVSL